MKSKEKKTVHIDTVLSYVALVILGGFAYLGVMSEIDAKPSVQTTIAVILVGLLLKTTLRR